MDKHKSLRLVIRQILKEEFIMKSNTGIKEGQEIGLLDMREEAQAHVEESINACNVIGSEMYQMKKMADYISADFPELAQEIIAEVEPMIIRFEQFYPKKFQEILGKFK